MNPTATATEKLLTLRDCREAAQVSRWTLWDWTTKRGLRTVQIGGCVRVKQSDWESFLAKHTGTNGNGEVKA